MRSQSPRRAPARAAILILVVALGGIVPATATYDPIAEAAALDRAVTARNILPPGTGRYLNTPELALAQSLGLQPAGNTNQIAMYENIVKEAPTLDDADVAALFKDASFTVPASEIGRQYNPRPGLTVIRDGTFDVPHVYGQTRYDTMFGAGYVSGEDRLFMMDVLRHLGRGRLSELLGATEDNLAADRAQRLGADYTEDELAAMGARLLDKDPELGFLAQSDFNAFADGVNAFITEALLDPTKLPAEYPALQIVPTPWKLTDSVAEATLIGATFSVGGAGQLDNAAFLNALEDEYPGDPATARAIFDDFRNAADPEAPTNTDEEFPLNDPVPPVNPAAVARPDDPTALSEAMKATEFPPAIDGPFGKIRLASPRGSASNALLVGTTMSASGVPVAVMGPQVGYWSPEILNEISIHGPGVHARGAAFPGISLYVLLGRGRDYAWSATTAVGDHQDIRAVKLCNTDGSPASGSSKGYLHNGTCRDMYSRTDTFVAKPSAACAGSEQSCVENVVVSFPTERTHHGIVVARGTVLTEPVAFVRQRSSYGREVDSTLAYTTLHDPARIQDLGDLQHAFGDNFSYSFNWHLITGDDMGFITTGRYPVLAAGVDPDLPFWGDSQWDWQRFLDFEELPQANGSTEPFITNWNNKQAPRFRAADDNWAYGAVQRKQLLTENLLELAGGGLTLTEVVKAMGTAATQDLRGTHALPLMLEVLESQPIDDDRIAAAVDLLSDWANVSAPFSQRAHRRDSDLTPGAGAAGQDQFGYDDAAAVALMDALWSPALKEVFGPALGDAFGLVPLSHSNQPGPNGSAFFGGWYSHMNKDLRTVLGDPVTGAYSQPYCGAGDLAACRGALIDALDSALDFVESKWTTDTSKWDAQENRDNILFAPVGVQGQRDMHWQNRPTFQQVVEFLPSDS